MIRDIMRQLLKLLALPATRVLQESEHTTPIIPALEPPGPSCNWLEMICSNAGNLLAIVPAVLIDIGYNVG
jgi:hypothetical protein